MLSELDALLLKLNEFKIKYMVYPRNTLVLIKPRRLKWARRAARMEEGRSALNILIGKPTGWRFHEGIGVNGRIVLELI